MNAMICLVSPNRPVVRQNMEKESKLKNRNWYYGHLISKEQISVGGAMRQGSTFSSPTCSLINTHPVANRICDGNVPGRRLRIS